MKLTGIELELILESLNYISDLPLGFDPILQKMKDKYGWTNEMFYEIRNELLDKIENNE